MLRRTRRATAASIGRVVASAIPSATIIQHSSTKLWLTEQDEPFAIVDLYDQGAVLVVKMSAHCTPQWAGILTALLAKAADDVSVLPEVFIQDHHGKMLHGDDAEAYWHWYRGVKPLLTARFASPERH
jgi:hypothetical protein